MFQGGQRKKMNGTTNDFRKALSEGQIEGDIEKGGQRKKKSKRESKGTWTCVS